MYQKISCAKSCWIFEGDARSEPTIVWNILELVRDEAAHQKDTAVCIVYFLIHPKALESVLVNEYEDDLPPALRHH